MACGCKNKEKRVDLNYVINLATVLSKTIKLDTMVFKDGVFNNLTLFNFAPIDKNKKDIELIIKYNSK